LDEREPAARVTIQMLYSKQLENERLLIELNAKLSNLDNLPERMSRMELNAARTAWVERVAWAGLMGALLAIVNQIVGVV
jgi:hypothetical protein